MKETTQLTETEYRLFEKLLSSGHSVKPDQIRTCQHCRKAYKLSMALGAGKNSCGDEPCKLAERAAQVKAEHAQKKERYRAKQQEEVWKHDPARRNYKQRRVLESVAEFSYV